MRKVWSGAAALAVAAFAVAAAAPQAVNTTCPVKGQAVKPGITSNYKGKVVGFCWGGCKGRFDSNPEQFISSIPGLGGPPTRSGLASLDEAFKGGKEGKQPVVLLFGDAGPRTKLVSQILGDPSLDETFGKVAYATIEFKKDDEQAKKYKVTAAPTLLILDATGETPKELKKMTSVTPAGFKREVEAAIKKIASNK